MALTIELLQRVAEDVIRKLRSMSSDEFWGMVVLTDYHGFAKSRFSATFFQEVVRPYGLNAEEIQLDVVYVNRDLTKEVHSHRKATAVVICMGETEHVTKPLNAQAFLGKSWFPVGSGDIVPIPAGTPHGFTVHDGGALYFLSVQSPPIVRGNGQDDYVVVST